MLISPPFLLPDPPSEETLLEEGLKQPGSREATTSAPEGNYPLSQLLMWHTGIHLSAPNGKAPKKLPVSAIADGTVIFIQNQRFFLPGTSAQKGDGQTYNPFGDKPSWCDNGMVIIEHTTDIGASGNTPTKVTYYSYYYHMGNIHPCCTVGKKIYRKEEIGTPGKIYGNDGQLEMGSHYWGDPTLRDSHGKIIDLNPKIKPKIWFPRFDPSIIHVNSYNACDSGGFCWVSKPHSGEININRVADRPFFSNEIGRVSVLVNGGNFGYFSRQAYAQYIARLLSDDTETAKKKTFDSARNNINIEVDFTIPQ